MEEIWKDIKGYEGLYKVSNLGRVKGKNGIRRVYCNTNRTKNYVTLSKNNIQTKCMVHRLVAEAFIDNPNNYTRIIHKNNNSNDSVNNLKWVSEFDWRKFTGVGGRPGVSKIGKQVVCIETEKVYKSLIEAERKTGVSKQVILNVCMKRALRGGGYHWKFADDKMTSEDIINSQLCVEDLENEEWRDVKGYEGLYQVSNLGRVKSHKFGTRDFILQNSIPYITRRTGDNKKIRYLTVRLFKNDIAKSFTVHRLVADAFLSKPENPSRIFHLDEDKHNNSVNNLEWVPMRKYKKI